MCINGDTLIFLHKRAIFATFRAAQFLPIKQNIMLIAKLHIAKKYKELRS